MEIMVTVTIEWLELSSRKPDTTSHLLDSRCMVQSAAIREHTHKCTLKHHKDREIKVQNNHGSLRGKWTEDN